MIDKRFSFMYTALFGFFISIMIMLMTLLFVEYRFFCNQAKELIELKQQYAECIELLNRKISQQYLHSNSARPELVEGYPGALEEILQQVQNERNIIDEGSSEDFPESSPLAIQEIMVAEASDAPDDDDDYVDDSFVVINRHPDYLKQSSIDYIESQD